jgi:Domain of unknown function (DUF6249)
MSHLVPVAFLAFLTVCAVAGIVADYKKRRVSLEPLRAAIERGQQLDPSVIERLMSPEREEGLNPIYLKVGAIIVLSIGAGLAILAVILAQVEPSAFYPILGGAAVVLCIGAGLLLAARAVAQQNAAQSERRQQAAHARPGN